MKKIRIGNDIVIKWRITVNGEEVNLEGLDLSLYISTTYQPRKAIAFTVAGNEITATYKGSEQRVTGVYRLTLYRNEGENAQSILDACDAFELVSCSCLTVDAAFGGAEVELPVADLGVGIPGLSAYEIAVSEGFVGTQAEWIASLSAASEAAAAECREVIAEFSQAEDSRVTAEAQRVANENSRIAGEGSRVEAENDRAAAEQLRATAESKRDTAELTRIANENKRADAEGTRSSAEDIRVFNENTRVADEETRVQSEAARVTAESKRANAEAQRETSEADRRSAEQVRIGNETARQTAEQDRMNSEANRVEAENLRKTAEDARIANEATRQANEQARVAAETSRESAETDRADAEAARVEAEQARVEEFAGFSTALAAKEDVANKVTSINADADDTHYPTAKAVKDSLAKVKNIEVTPDMLSESTKQFINASGGGTITNFADDEDLTTVDNALKLADKAYDPITYSGMGRKYLRKNLVGGKNILTQEMLPSANTIYIIQYDYDLNGATITIPENCTLDFQGGSLGNGTIVFDKTYLGSAVSIVKCVLKGDILNEDFYVDWFGAKVNSTQDSTDAFKVISDYAYQRFLDNGSNVVYCTRKLILSPGTYCVTNINLQGGINLIGAGSYSTVIKSISDTDKAVVTITRNDTIIRDLAIDGGAKEGYQNIGLYMYGNNGQNSIVDNVRLINCYKKSAVIEDTNHVILSHCAFNGGHDGYLLLDGADNIKVLYCNFETGEEFTAPYAIKLQTEITTNKTANNAIISGCWFESGSAETFKTSIYVDCMNVTIENNHFHAATACVKDYVCYVGDNTDNIKFIYNNIQNTGTNESGEREKVLGVSENAQTVYVAYNRGMWNANNTEILNSKTFVVFMDGSQLLPNNHTIVTNEVPFYIKTTSVNTNIYKGAIRFNNAWIWYDLNQVLKIKYGSAPNNAYDGEPIGNYVAAAWSDGYPSSTQYQIGRCYFDRGENILAIWNGTAWIRVSDGVSKDIRTSGDSNQKPKNADVPIGYMYYDNTNKRYIFNDGAEWRLPNGYINNTAGGSGIRPTGKLSSVDAGFMFFDTTLNKPIWWNGSAWVDATGATV